MRRHLLLPLLAVLSVWLACAMAAEASSSAADVAEVLAEGVGRILAVGEGDPERLILVFEERHDSILAQIEIAIMLDRAYESFGLRHVGLEGVAQTDGPLDLSWAHRPPVYRPDQPITNREDVIAHTLFQGEIGAGEMMGLIYEDVVVDGIDAKDLYAVDASDDIWSAPFNYLYNIAVAEMSSSEYDRWKRLYDQKQYADAEEYAIGTNSFTQEFHGRLTDAVNGPSAEEILEIYALLRSRARRANVTLPPETQQALQACVEYLEIVSQRSDAMARSALELSSAHRGSPVAINVGFMHTERIAQLLEDAGVSFAVFRSESHALGTDLGLLSQEALERKANGLSVGEEGHIGAFLDGRKKPPVACTKWWYASEIALAEALQMLLYFCWDFTLEEGTHATEERPDLNKVIAEAGLGSITMVLRNWPRDEFVPIKDFLAGNYISLRNVVWSSSTNPTTGKAETIIVRAEATIGNPYSKETVELEGIAELSPETGRKGKISLREALERGREALLEPTQDAPKAEETRPVQTCSDTTTVWKGA